MIPDLTTNTDNSRKKQGLESNKVNNYHLLQNNEQLSSKMTPHLWRKTTGKILTYPALTTVYLCTEGGEGLPHRAHLCQCSVWSLTGDWSYPEMDAHRLCHLSITVTKKLHQFKVKKDHFLIPHGMRLWWKLQTIFALPVTFLYVEYTSIFSQTDVCSK